MMEQSRKYGITNEMIARWLGYSSVQSFENSSKRDKVQVMVEKVVKHMTEEMKQRIQEAINR